MEINAFNEETDVVPEINKDFGRVCCGKKAIEYVKIRNTSKKIQSIFVIPVKGEKILYGRLRINPEKSVAPPGKSVRLTLTYLSNLENLTDVISYNIFECEKLVALLRVQARTLGPCISPKIYNVKFFRFRDVNQSIKNVTLENLNKCEAKFYFDLDEDYKQIQISQTHGVLPAESKLNLKMFFNSSEPGIYYRTIFCLIQYHPPLIFNVLSVYQPKLKLEPKNLNLRYPLDIRPHCNYMAYMEKLKIENAAEGEKISFLQKCAAERDCLSGTTNAEAEEEMCWSAEEYNLQQQLNKDKINKTPVEVYLTKFFVDIKNQQETLRGTTLVNVSKCQRFYYEWDQDPNDNFQIHPGQGIIEPNMKTYFNIYFSPCGLDLLYHTEIDLRVFPCDNEFKVSASDIIDLPLTQSLRIIGNSFPDDSCGWMAQCAVVPKTLQLPSCVPEENVYGTFVIERRGHLPVLFKVLPSKEMNYSVQPPLGYVSRDFQLFVVEFNGKSKEEGVYSEDLKIIFNNSESSYEILKVATSVEIPKLTFGNKNSYTFKMVFPGAQTSETISIKNPTNLNLRYEFKTPEDITWCEVLNPNGVIESNSFSEVTVIFKPKIPCEYAGSLECWVSSLSRTDFVKIVHLHLKGSCQYGYLIATPSVYDYGNCYYLEQKSTKIHLFNFSPVLIHFQLTATQRDYLMSDVKQDVIITPSRGAIPGKGSFEVEVDVIPHNKGMFQYEISCQNLADDSENAPICDEPRTIFSFRFEGIISTVQIIDLNLEEGRILFSPQWLWRMINTDKINKALNSLEREVLIDMNFPQAPVNSPDIRLCMLIKANKHGNFFCTIQKQQDCPCLEASDSEVTSTCYHSTQMNLVPSTIDLKPNEEMIVRIFISYQYTNLCMFEWTVFLPHKRKLILRAKTVALPYFENFAIASIYQNSVFHLKPVFIGDVSPPLQLFWLYNNSNQPAAYSVVNITLGEDTWNVERIFECINPVGVIPPFSALPLSFLFRPDELKRYVGYITVRLHESKTQDVIVEGEGIPDIQQNKELALERPKPKNPTLCYSKVDLRCSSSFINIHLHRTFSKIKRIFFIVNESRTTAWYFRWHAFKINSLVYARIHPSEGRIEPGQKVLMTLTFESFSYPTTISFSIPCDVINYSALKAYEEAVRLQKITAEKALDYFTITEKGIMFENPNIEIPEKPQLHHIFVWVKANIFNNKNIEMKLRPQQQQKLKAESEIETCPQVDVFLKTSTLKPILQVLEKILWDITNKREFWRKIESEKNSNDFKYLQFLPESRRKRKKFSDPKKLQISYIQSLFEGKLKDVLVSNFICTTEEENPHQSKKTGVFPYKN